MNKKRVLYVDDELDIREVAEISLQLDPQLEVRTCGGGAEAIEIAGAWVPDLVLLDVMMPGMDGPSTLAKLRGDPQTSSIPVIFITARAHPDDMRQLMALGAAGVIAKPFEPMELAGQVRAMLDAQSDGAAADD